MRPVTGSPRGARKLLPLILLAVGLTLWIGPRPIHDPWVAETVPPGRVAELGASPDCVAAPAAGKGSSREALMDLAEANGIPPGALPPLGPGAAMLDADNDGDLDIFAPGSTAPEAGSMLFYLNDGEGRFREVGRRLGAAFRRPRALGDGDGRVWTLCGDLDRDGMLDLVLPMEDGGRLVLWNRLARRRFLRLRLRSAGGSPEPSSQASDPARVELIAGGKTQVRIVGLGPAAGAVAHFGLGELGRADRIAVAWPSGRRSVLEGIEADREHEVVEPGVAETRVAEPGAAEPTVAETAGAAPAEERGGSGGLRDGAPPRAAREAQR